MITNNASLLLKLNMQKNAILTQRQKRFKRDIKSQY